MLTPFTIWLTFSLLVALLCWFKPQAGRIFVGIFFILMALGVHVGITLSNPAIYLAFADTAYLPLYRWLFENVVALSPVLFGLLAALFELTVAFLILGKGRRVQFGLLLAILFQLAITPLSFETLACPAFALALALLLRHHYPHSLLDLLRARLGRPARLAPHG